MSYDDENEEEVFRGYDDNYKREKLETQESYYQEQEQSQQFVHAYKDQPLGGVMETDEEKNQRIYMEKINYLLENNQLTKYKDSLKRFTDPPLITLNPYALVEVIKIYDKKKQVKDNKELSDSNNYRRIDLIRYYKLVKRVGLN